jgi:hypothetical protein
MDAGGIKELKVMLRSDEELKALTGEKKPRRRGTRKQRGGAATGAETPESGRVSDGGGSLSPMAAAVAEGPAARIEKLDGGGNPVGITAPVSGEGRGAPLIGGGGGAAISPLATGLSITPSAVTLPMLAPTSVVGGGGVPNGDVKIGGKRGLPTVNTVHVPRIVPKKRTLGAAPAAQTLKKPKFKVGGGAPNPETSVVTQAASSGEPAPALASGAPQGGGAAKQTRRFKERKLKLTVKSSRVAKAVRRKVKLQVRAMPLADVRKTLIKKGIIKATAAEKLPEEMLRNMLRDYLLLHTAE